MSFRSTIVPLLLLGLLAGCDRQVSTQEQANANKLPVEDSGTPAGELARQAAPAGDKVIVDTIGALDRSHKGAAAPLIPFQDSAGQPTSIAAFKGKPMLVNLWATWCPPCVAEMPTLDAAASNITVLTISQDTGDEARARVTSFFAKGRYTRLKANLEPKADLSVAYNASLPTSILYDSAGREVWRITGGMDWTSATARELLAEAK